MFIISTHTFHEPIVGFLVELDTVFEHRVANGADIVDHEANVAKALWIRVASVVRRTFRFLRFMQKYFKTQFIRFESVRGKMWESAVFILVQIVPLYYCMVLKQQQFLTELQNGTLQHFPSHQFIFDMIIDLLLTNKCSCCRDAM